MTRPTVYDFTKKLAFITGASTGIGHRAALDFARFNAIVVLADLNESAGKATADKIISRGGIARFIKCDVSKEADVQNAISQTIKEFGRIDFAFNNAGVEGQVGTTADCTIDNWDKVIQINLSGVWYCMKYQIQQMLKQGHGSIVNCSSIAGVIGFPGIPAYTASKHGVIGLTKTAALEYAKQNIRVNAVCPGVIHTEMIDRFTHGEAQALQQMINGEPVGRMGRPDEVSEAVLWLSSEASSFVTGHSLVVDGGWVAQ